MKKLISCLVLTSLLFQIGCSSITQIPYPVDENKSENEIRSLNYFGERLNSTIQFTNSIEVEAYWLKMKDDKVYFLTEGLDDTTSVTVDKIESVKFFDWWKGCLFGSLSGIFLYSWIGLTTWNLYASLVGFSLGMSYGMYALTDREFNFVQSKPTIE